LGAPPPARTRHSTTAQSPPDCSPASLSSELVPPPWVTVRPAPGPERTGSLRAMVSSLIGNGLPWNDPVPRASTAAHDRVIASVNRPEAGPTPITWELRTRRSPRAPNEPSLRGRWHGRLARQRDIQGAAQPRPYLQGGGSTRVGSRGPIVPTFRPFARRCCRTSRRRRSLWPCRETTPREALDPLDGRRRPHWGAQAPRQPRAPTPPPQDAVVAPSPVARVPPSGTSAAGRLPLADGSRATPPAHPPPRCAG